MDATSTDTATENARSPAAHNFRKLHASLPLPAQSKSIRFFELDPARPGDPQIIIRGQLRVVDLEETPTPKYVALSYVWGASSDPQRTVLCGGYSVGVTDNCWDALHHLRYDSSAGAGATDQDDPGRNEDGSIALWIDALCMNQSDEDEKMSQIPLMGDIYSLAVSTCIWLGPGTPDTDRAADYLKLAGWQDRLEKHGKFAYKIPGPWTAYMFGLMLLNPLLSFTSPRERRRRAFPDLQGTIHIQGLNDILNRPWVTRVWTLQEAVLSPNPWVLCGTRRLDWRTILYGVTYLDRVGEVFEVPDLRIDTCRRWRGIINLWFVVHTPHQDTKPTSPFQFEEFLGNYTTFLERVEFVAIEIRILIFFIPLSTILIAASAFLASPYSMFPEFILSESLLLAILVFLRLFYPKRRDAKQGLTGRSRELHASTEPDGAALVAREILDRKATDPRDKSHGVHAVLKKRFLQLEPPNKSTSLEAIYRDLFLTLLNKSGDLNILFCATGTSAPFSSWVPDWNADFGTGWIDMGDLLTAWKPRPGPVHHYKPRAVQYPYKPWGDASACSPVKFHLSNHRELVVEGYDIGHVIWRGGTFFQTHDVVKRRTANPFSPRERESCLRNIEIIQEAYQKAAQWRQGVANMGIRHIFYRDSESPEAVTQKTLAEWHKVFAQNSARPAGTVLTNLQSRENTWRLHVDDVCENLSLRQRTIFSWATRNGSDSEALGNCPIHTKVGDVIVLLSGASLPAILRRCGSTDRFLFVGYAIIDSKLVMGGGFWRKQGPESLREFVIS